MDAEPILCELRDGNAWIRLNRPEARNALSAALVNALHARLLDADRDEAVRSIIITGEGSAFCSGADLKSPPGGVIGGERSVGMAELLTTMVESSKPIIAAVNGSAFAGGLGLVGASDIVIAAEDAVFSFSEVRIGVIPGIISVVCVPKLGVHNAMKLFLTGERFTGRDAVALGLAHRAVAAGDLEAAVRTEAEMIRLGGPAAVRECKKLVRRVASISMEQGFRETTPWSLRMFQSEEAAEGMAAFREKRRPAWVEPQSGEDE
ncbi:enoyl-CoA hydratase [bacterium]|nr:enoyl-CoA hydratase [bacterium]